MLIDKPEGMTSHDVVAIARRATGTRRIGHAGTLDPFATGLLVLLVGRVTRLLPYVDGEPKVYDATIAFGTETTTDDCTGSVTHMAAPPTQAQIMAVLPTLTGWIAQLPPAYSAKQLDGVRAYAAARRGNALALAPVRVFIEAWKILAQRDDAVDVRIRCGGGTYIRALARDLGRGTGSAAHLACLRRVSSGPFDVANAMTIARLREGPVRLLPARSAVPSLPARSLDDDELRQVSHGIAIEAVGEGERFVATDSSGALVAILGRDGQRLAPKVVFRDG